jgi:NADH-quinone oxidoreductase subunit G
MTRCIHCTRCIRFLDEVAGVHELGATGRGEHMEIGTWIERAITSELSGNIIDLCPVGALNSKPYEFRARSWELKKTESVDVHDAVGCNIRIDSRGSEVMRVLPRLNEEINEEWLSDKSRFSYDGLKRRRLDTPMLRKDGRLEPVDWRTAFAAIGERLEGVAGERIAAIVGDLACCESMTVLKDLMAHLESPHLDCRQEGARIGGGSRAGHLFNTTIAGIEQADLCLLIGTDPRYEAPLVNARLRKRWRRGGFSVARIGAPSDLTYPVKELGAGPQTLQELQDGAHDFAGALEAAERPMLILGTGALVRPDGARVLGAARALAERFGLVRGDWNGFNVLHLAASRVGGLELGILPGEGGRDVAGILDGAGEGAIEIVFLHGADEIDTSQLGEAFVVYVGHHGDRGAHRADVILPGAAYSEKNATYVNLEGRPQRAKLAVFPPGEAREEWKIFRALSEALGRTVPLDSLAQVRERMAEFAPHLAAIDRITPAEWGPFGEAGAMDRAPFGRPVGDFYQTDAICRASRVMAECSALFAAGGEATGTHG